MIEWLFNFALKFLETCIDFLPIAVVLIGFQLLVIRRPLVNAKKTLVGFVFVLLGIVFFSARTGYGFIPDWVIDGLPVDHA